MRIAFFATLVAVAAAIPLGTVCDENVLAQTAVGKEENLCTLSSQLQAAQKELEDKAERELKSANEAIATAKSAQKDAEKAKSRADQAQAKADGLAGSTSKARQAIADAEAKKNLVRKATEAQQQAEAAKERKTVEATQLVSKAKNATRALKSSQDTLTKVMGVKGEMVDQAQAKLNKI